MYQKESSCLGAEESRRSMVLSSSPLYHHPEVRLLVPDFTVSLCTAVHVIWSFSDQEIYRERTEERMRPQKRELHELPYLEIAKSGTIRLASGSTIR